MFSPRQFPKAFALFLLAMTGCATSGLPAETPVAAPPSGPPQPVEFVQMTNPALAKPYLEKLVSFRCRFGGISVMMPAGMENFNGSHVPVSLKSDDGSSSTVWVAIKADLPAVRTVKPDDQIAVVAVPRLVLNMYVSLEVVELSLAKAP
jgi:hypothetical protein